MCCVYFGASIVQLPTDDDGDEISWRQTTMARRGGGRSNYWWRHYSLEKSVLYDEDDENHDEFLTEWREHREEGEAPNRWQWSLSLSEIWIGTDEDKYEHIMPNDGGMQRFWREHVRPRNDDDITIRSAMTRVSRCYCSPRQAFPRRGRDDNLSIWRAKTSSSRWKTTRNFNDATDMKPRRRGLSISDIIIDRDIQQILISTKYEGDILGKPQICCKDDDDDES